jgi:MFS family permease
MEASWRDRAFVPVVLYTGGCAGIISSLGAPLIPMLAQRLHVSLSAAQWSLTATLVVGAVASPLLGRLGDGRHRKSTILGCLLLVVLGCIMAAVATSLAVLVIGRALQGLGIALTPLTMSAARERLAPERARRTIAALSVIGAAGVGLGYPVTGLIANELDVSAAYWVGAGASVVALLLCVAVFPRPKLQTDTGRLDIPGAAIISIGLVGVLIAADKGPDWGWGSTCACRGRSSSSGWSAIPRCSARTSRGCASGSACT